MVQNPIVNRLFYLALLIFWFNSAYTQESIPVIKSGSRYVTLRDGNLLLKDYWTINPNARPDIWDVIVPYLTTKKVSFITDRDSITFDVALGKSYDFIILLNEYDSAFTRIETHPEPAIFSKNYIEKNNNKTLIEIPEFYEFMNVVLALTDKGMNDTNMVTHSSAYHKETIDWFANYSNEKVIQSIDSLLKSDYWNYFNLKMDAYAFEFKKDKIIRSLVYDRISWGGKNTLIPFITQLENLAIKSNFKKFYKIHLDLYLTQIKYYKDSLNIAEVQNWLNKNFPESYFNCMKVIFSPLAGTRHSSNWFENNGFREVQAHVNFPYRYNSENNFIAATRYITEGNAVFNQMSHAFINPESEKYTGTADFQFAFSKLSNWETENSAASRGYPNAYACFNEYMSWGLVSLRYADLVPPEDLEDILHDIEKNQMEARGFFRFPEFNRNLITLYRNKKPGETIADLYPQIIKWCKDQIK